jgi:orotate phosphoribosyltransferase
MKRKFIVLPLDGFASAEALMDYLRNLLDELAGDELLDYLAYIKLNDGVHNLDAGGPLIVEQIIAELKKRDLPVEIFLDLKIGDVSATVTNVLKKYQNLPIGILTVSSLCSVETLIKLRLLMPDTKLAMLSALTDISREEFQIRFGMTPGMQILKDWQNISAVYHSQAGKYENWQHPLAFDLVVCSPEELEFLNKNLPAWVGTIVPSIRDEWMRKANEHQKRFTGVRQALNEEATFVVMGAQFVKGNPDLNISPQESRRLTLQEVKLSLRFESGDPLELLKSYEGYYCSKIDVDGIVGPLVAYAGTYPSEDGPKNFVGYEYFNFAKAEPDPAARSYFANLIAEELSVQNLTGNVVLGAPMGGILLASTLGEELGVSTIFAEKKVTALADPANGKKEQSVPIIERHSLKAGDRVIIVEDVVNNFSTTQKLHDIITAREAKLVAIACAFNRSGKNDWNGIPVVAALSIKAKQFHQNDPAVATLMAGGEIVWHPKDEWPVLKKAMED